MTKEEAWLEWMKTSKGFKEYHWEDVKKTSWWAAFEQGWNAGFSEGVRRTGEGWNGEYPGMKDSRMHEWIRRETEVTGR